MVGARPAGLKRTMKNIQNIQNITINSVLPARRSQQLASQSPVAQMVDSMLQTAAILAVIRCGFYAQLPR